MGTSVRPRRWGTNHGETGKRSVICRYAAVKRIAEATAKDHFLGRGGPLIDVELMAACAGQAQRFDVVEGLIQRLEAAGLTANPLDYWAAKEQYDLADASEDVGQAAFDRLVRLEKVTFPIARRRHKEVLHESAAARQFAHALTTEFGL